MSYTFSSHAKHLTLAAVFFCLLLPAITLAQTPTSSTSSTATSADTTAANNDASTEEAAALGERTQTRIRNLAANISNRMDAAINRLNVISDRTESRIEKLSARGIDTIAAEQLMNEARGELSQAETSIGTIDTEVAFFIGSTDPLTEWRDVRTQFVDTRTSIVDAHRTLQAVVRELQQAIQRAAQGIESTPSPATTTATTSNLQ